MTSALPDEIWALIILQDLEDTKGLMLTCVKFSHFSIPWKALCSKYTKIHRQEQSITSLKGCLSIKERHLQEATTHNGRLEMKNNQLHAYKNTASHARKEIELHKKLRFVPIKEGSCF